MSLVVLTLAAMCGMSGNSGPQGQEQKSDPLGLLYFLCNVHCTTFTVFLHYGFGSEALGFPGLGALILIILCMASDARMLYWLMAFLVALIIQRIFTFAYLGRGYALHSMDPGLPLLSKVLPFVSVKSAIVMEAVLCLVTGGFMFDVSPFIGKYLMWGCITLIVRTAIEVSVINRRMQRLRDQELEARWLAERFRGRGNY